MASIHEVAERAGVSKSTVSRVLNGGSVSSAARVAVLDAIEAMGYYPNAAARNLARQTTKTIGIVVSDVADPYYSEIIRGIEGCASEAGFDVLLGSSQQDERREMAFLRKLMEKQVDGLLVLSCSSLKAQKALVAFARDVAPRRPMVVLERTLPGTSIHTVDIDNAAAAEVAVRHLINLGHKRIGHIAGPAHQPWGASRRQGYSRALAHAGIFEDDGLVVSGNFTHEGGYEAAKRLLRLPSPPTAVFAANDVSALGAWKAAREAGLAVPQSLALVGFDDIEMLSLGEIPLTTVRQPRRRMGVTAAHMLLSMLEHGVAEEGYSTILPTELVVRESCGHRIARSGPEMGGEADEDRWGYHKGEGGANGPVHDGRAARAGGSGQG